MSQIIDFNLKISELTSNFKENLKSIQYKQQLHYNSVLNISKSIQNYSDPKAQELKKLLIRYLEKVKNNGFQNIRTSESSKDYEEYLLPLFTFLVYKEGYRSKASVKAYTIIGLLIDVSIFIILDHYYYPITAFIFLLISFIFNHKAKKEGRFASMFW